MTSGLIPSGIRKELAELQELETKLAQSIVDQSKQYHTTVLTVGYAGAFGIWAFCKDFIPQQAQVSVALLIGVSLMLYVLFEIFNVMLMAIWAIQAHKLTAKVEIPEKIDDLSAYITVMKNRGQEYQRRLQNAARKNILVWPFFFFPSLLFGLGGVFLLMYNFISHLIPSYISYFPS